MSWWLLRRWSWRRREIRRTGQQARQTDGGAGRTRRRTDGRRVDGRTNGRWTDGFWVPETPEPTSGGCHAPPVSDACTGIGSLSSSESCVLEKSDGIARNEFSNTEGWVRHCVERICTAQSCASDSELFRLGPMFIGTAWRITIAGMLIEQVP